MKTKNLRITVLDQRGEFPATCKSPGNVIEAMHRRMDAVPGGTVAIKTLSRFSKRSVRRLLGTAVFLSSLSLLSLSPAAYASIAYGSINNFDTVNDTGVPCHGFEIEIDDIHSKDITYTYDWNHYGVPKITEDNFNFLHPKVFVRYESGKNPDSTWAAYTAVPSGPIPPTAGHQFTDPSVNFGGEHFGVGFTGTPTAVKYSWLKDDGAGNLVFAGAVNISTPTFTYVPPVNGVPAQVQAAIVVPPPPAPPPLEFGPASWVKETRTSSHNNQKVELRDLVSPDPNDPNSKDWRNGEPDEVEVEWQLFQTDFNAGNGGANGELVGAPEGLAHGDEVVTRRYDFFKYIGPLDPETGEALAGAVGPDGIHGTGNYADVVVVGDYVGAQMAGFDAAGKIGLIDHLQDGAVNVPYVERTIVIGGTAPIATTRTGALPDGMVFDEVTGVLSGTPTVSGLFTFTIHSVDSSGGDVMKAYNLNIPGDFIPSISGVVTLEQCAVPEQTLTLEFRPLQGGVPIDRILTLSSTGAFAVMDVPSGQYNLAIKGSKWLRTVIAVDSTFGNVTDANATLLGGDANNDNSVDISDFGSLINAYGGDVNVPGSGYDTAADFNCDGTVDIGDFGILNSNFGVAGAL